MLVKARVSGQPPRVYRRSAAVGLNRGPAEDSPEPASRPLRFVVVLGRGFVAASVLCLGALCGFAVLVLSAPARAILSRSGLGAAYGPSRGEPQILFDNLRRWSALVFSMLGATAVCKTLGRADSPRRR